jgi:hypothetical protein
MRPACEDFDAIRARLQDLQRRRKRCAQCSAIFDDIHVPGCKHSGRVIESECEEPQR